MSPKSTSMPRSSSVRGLQRDDRPAVVAVQVPALAVVVQQAVAVAEVDLARHAG